MMLSSSLHAVQMEAKPIGYVEHAGMKRRTLAASEADVAKLPVLADLRYRPEHATWREHPC